MSAPFAPPPQTIISVPVHTATWEDLADGTFAERALEAGVATSDDGQTYAGSQNSTTIFVGDGASRFVGVV